jgi:glucose/arabinose dehydrogenase
LNVLALASLAAGAAHAQLKWDGCPDLAANQFKKTLLVSRTSTTATAGVTAVDAELKEPVKLTVSKAGDVYIAERGGNIKVWKNGTLTTIGKINVFSQGKLPHPSQNNNENGLVGIVLDPNFATNKWIYTDYTPLVGNFQNISRWTLGADGKLDMTSEKILLQVPIQRNSCCHTGGGMEFDLQGHLFITTGNNTTNPGTGAANAYVNESEPTSDPDDQAHAANTNDLRGKVLRIKPKADGTYEVPDGNLFPKGTDKTKPEIWAMGIRNPYSLAVDKYRGWVAWGEVGPDDNLSYSEEWNLFTKPGNGGWPYFVGDKAWRPALGKVASAPVNNSKWNTGLNNLPPAVSATIGYKQSCAITGPIYHYDGSNSSTKKLPPHLNKKWLVSDWWIGNLEAVTMSEDGQSVISRTVIQQPQSFQGPLDFQVGPDGALYVIEYGQVGGGLWFNNAGNTAISRLEYTGTCHPTTPVPTSLRDIELAKAGSVVGSINLGLRRDVEVPNGVAGFRLYDVQGRQAWEYKLNGNRNPGKVAVPATVGNGILRVKYF